MQVLVDKQASQITVLSWAANNARPLGGVNASFNLVLEMINYTTWCPLDSKHQDGL